MQPIVWWTTNFLTTDSTPQKCYRMQGCAVHWSITNASWGPNWCRHKYHESLAPFLTPHKRRTKITPAWHLWREESILNRQPYLWGLTTSQTPTASAAFGVKITMPTFIACNQWSTSRVKWPEALLGILPKKRP